MLHSGGRSGALQADPERTGRMPWRLGRCLGRVQARNLPFLMPNLDWSEIFRQRPDLAPPGYEEAIGAAREATERRYEQNGRKRAKGASKRTVRNESRAVTRQREQKFNGMKHSSKDP